MKVQEISWTLIIDGKKYGMAIKNEDGITEGQEEFINDIPDQIQRTLDTIK